VPHNNAYLTVIQQAPSVWSKTGGSTTGKLGDRVIPLVAPGLTSVTAVGVTALLEPGAGSLDDALPL